MTSLALSRRRHRSPQISVLLSSSLNFRWFAIVTCVGALSGLIIPTLGALRQPILLLALLGLTTKLVDFIVRRDFPRAWAITAFLCALEPAFRTHARILPYFTLAYILMGCGLLTLALTRPRKGARVVSAIAYSLYIAFEVSGSALANSAMAARAIVVPSLLMLLFLVNARRVRLSASETTLVLAAYVTGAVILASFALRAYFAGNITWGTESNFEASGGMPPNHISVLLAFAVFACVVLAETADRTRRIAILAVATLLGVLMVLTFSRGGTVLVTVALLVYYLFLRPATRRTLLVLTAIALMGLAISYGARAITGGKVADRYGQTNTSNRFTIAVQGWEIYLDNPVVGVGTSNFYEAISDTEFGTMSGAHNELIRAAAEHGTLGLLTWLVFIGSAFVSASRIAGVSRARRGLRVVILIFATTSMFYNGLKLTVQPMLILLALSAFTVGDGKIKSGERRSPT